MEDSDSTVVLIRIVNEIDSCINQPSVDKKVYHYLHIYNMLSDDDRVLPDLEDLYTDCGQLLADPKKRQLIDYYYKILETEGGLILLDKRYKDKDIYDINSEYYGNLYETLNDLDLRIVIGLGQLKFHLLSQIKKDDGINLDFS